MPYFHLIYSKYFQRGVFCFIMLEKTYRISSLDLENSVLQILAAVKHRLQSHFTRAR
jgi:hypothetical protein